MAGAVDFLTAEMAQKAHIDAVNRDYICEPRLGASPPPGLPVLAVCLATAGVCATRPFSRSTSEWARAFAAADVCVSCPRVQPHVCPLLPMAALTNTQLSSCSCFPSALQLAEYRTVGGVAGPLVVVNTVKVRARKGCSDGRSRPASAGGGTMTHLAAGHPVHCVAQALCTAACFLFRWL